MTLKESAGAANGTLPNGTLSHGISLHQNGTEPPMPVAIVGMACRLPGSVSDLESFWNFCLAARNSWTEIPKQRLNTSAFHHPNPDKAGCFHLKGAHYLQESVASFDAPFFGITADEAKSLDPRHRMLLECTYEALENGGVPMSSVIGRDVGVYVGGTLSHYELHCLRDFETAPRLQYMGCADSLLANRISYFFDLHGPSVTVDTACSSGLAALHMACQSLRVGEVKQAIVGGCHLNLMPEVLASVSSSMFYSAEGKCFPFDERVSGGFGPGEGASCVVLKPLQDAIEAGDNIRAIIRNSGMNQDGRTQGISLPSSEAQAALVRSVYSSAGLEPTDTKYVEAHGTGTTVGDPLEAAAFADTIAKRANSEDPVYIGSAKSNFGHLEGVSGIVSVIKAAMMLENRVILPNANFETPNPKITSMGKALKVPTSALDWPSRGARRVSVNNLGFGGSNAHVILEEAPPLSDLSESMPEANGYHFHNGPNGVPSTPKKSDTVPYRLYIITANDEPAVKSQMRTLKVYLGKPNHESKKDLMADLAFTLGQRRSLLPWKIALVAPIAERLMEQLDSPENIPIRTTKTPNLGFVFTGQGANWQEMGHELFQTYPVFSSAIAAADRYLVTLGAPWSLIDALYNDRDVSSLQNAQISQPACTAIQLALVQLLDSFGVRPHSVTGHSSGEIGAAFAAGALTFESCLSIAYYRGVCASMLKENFPKIQGAMLALGTNPDEAASMIAELKNGQAVVACVNSPSSITASGDVGAIVELQAAAEEKKIFARRLHVDVAYHSPHMDFVAEDYRTAIGKVKPVSSKDVHFYSSLTGKKMSTLALGSSYWVSNLKSPVQFSDSLLACCSLDREGSTPETSVTHLIEIGPHSALKGPIRDILGAGPKTQYKIGYSSALVRNENAVASTLNMASELFMKGCHLNMAAINFPEREWKPKVLSDLPPYPWNHESEYWHESRISKGHRMRTRPRNDILGTLAADSNDLEPWWRNVVRLDDIPWLRHHRVRSNAVFPFAGYVSMAVEAASQRAGFRNVNYSKIELREISNSQPLIILEGVDTEMMFTLRPLKENARTSSEIWDEFRISSWTKDAGWVEHCRGQVAALSDRKSNDVEDARSSNMIQSAQLDQIRKIEAACVTSVESQKIFEAASNIGIEYGPCMTMLSDCRVGGNHAMASVRVPDTASTMPRQCETPLIVHPAFLDNCIQVVWPLLGAGLTEVNGLYLPTFVKNVCIRPSPNGQVRDLVRIFGTTAKASVRSELIVESVIVIDPDEANQPPAITFDGLIMVSVSDGQSTKEKREKSIYSKIHWEPCLDLLEPKEFQDYFRLETASDDEKKTVNSLERAALFYFETALRRVTDADFASLQYHHKRFYRLMQKQLQSAKNGENPLLEAQWDASSDSERKDFLDSVRSKGVSGEFTCKIGENIADIMLNGKDTLSIMLEDGLLEKFYRHSAPLIRNNKQAAMLVDILAHKNPNLRILEIGAGTGGVTLPILEKLGGVSGQVPRFQDYVFTDISSGFFENAQEKLKAWSTLMTYRRLNIEEDPVSQDFEPEAFDLIIAANVLHATTRMTRTLANVRRLLKPGGKLLLVEITTIRAQFFPFGTIPGWWAGEEEYRTDGPLLTENQWDGLLKESGFSGVDRSLHDYPEELVHSHSVMLSEASAAKSLETPKDLVIIQSHESSRLSIDILKEELSVVTGRFPWILSLSQISHMDLKDSHCIFLDELEHPMLANMSASDFRAVQNLCSAAGVLWVVQGGQVEPSNPESSMAVGLARCIRSENPAVRLVTLDLDAKQKLSASGTSTAVVRLYQAAFISGTASEVTSQESEYMERNGCFYIPRLVQDSAMDQCIQKATQNPAPEYQTYVEDSGAVSLRIETPGILDSFYFVEDESLDGPLKPDEVEIQVKASALNFRDVLTALGRVPYEMMGTDCAGVVSAVGSDVSDLAVDDRVCALGTSAFATAVRCAASSTVKIPETASFEDAGTLPVVCTTVYHSLVNVAYLRKGETILIHAAAGGVGQTAIMLSQKLG